MVRSVSKNLKRVYLESLTLNCEKREDHFNELAVFFHFSCCMIVVTNEGTGNEMNVSKLDLLY